MPVLQPKVLPPGYRLFIFGKQVVAIAEGVIDIGYDIEQVDHYPKRKCVKCKIFKKSNYAWFHAIKENDRIKYFIINVVKRWKYVVKRMDSYNLL